MKFTSTFSALLVVLPMIANVSGLTVPEEGLVARQRFRGQKGNNGNAAAQAAQAKANAANAAKDKANQAAAASKAAAATAAANKGGNKNNAGNNNAGAATGNAAAAAGNAAAATGNNAAAGGAATGNNGDLQSSLTISTSVLQTIDDGQNPPVTGQSPAAVSKNNFANFCAPGLPNVPITNGLQITTGSCNPTPIGNIPSVDKMPSAKFQSPKNGDTIPANTAFTVTLAAKNIQLGTFTNAQKTYFANPQTLNGQGQIIGHTHIVIEAVPSLDSTALTDPKKFMFFKGVDDPANGQGQVQVAVAAGVPPGTYRMGTIMSSATHQPVIVPIAQHGLTDDVVYFTATAQGGNAGAANNGAAAGAAGGAAAGAAGGAAAGAATAAGAGGANTGKTQTGANTGKAQGGQAKGGKGGKGGFKGKGGRSL